MDIGTIVIHLTCGRPVVSRCEDAPTGLHLLPAANAAELAAQATLVLQALGVSRDQDGLYLCSDQLQAAAVFPPLHLPDDAMTYGAARQLLYPATPPNTGWEHMRRDVKAGKLRVWRVGIGHARRDYISQAEVLTLATERR